MTTINHSPQSYYEQKKKEHIGAKAKHIAALQAISFARLVVFLAVVAVLYFFWATRWALLAGMVILLPTFMFLVLRHQKNTKEKNLASALVAINETELQVLEGNFEGLPDGIVYANDQHWYSQDIDLFGQGSFFQYINRTALRAGTDRLAEMLLSNDLQHIEKKQQAIRELEKMPEWRQHFTAVAKLVKTEVSSEKIMQWLHGYRPFLPRIMRWFSIAFSMVSVMVWGLYFFGLISGYVVFGVFLLGLAITGRFLPKISLLSGQITKAQSTFGQYAQLLKLLEETKFEAGMLIEHTERISDNQHQSSQVLKRFGRLLDTLDQRNNIIIGIVANAFLLRDLFVVHRIEAWIAEHRSAIPQWFETIAFFDAQNSLGNYAFNHKDHVFPTLKDQGDTWRTTGLTHPLLPKQTAVRNDISIGRAEFFIITGANMAGKSTFLRAVGLQIVMANVGLPVCAETATYHPIKLVSSMRTTDSLTDDESYFFSELKRLKYIMDTIAETPHFIILDEILKGTNSTDKAEGSQKFIEKLLGLKATGLIATHDLSLCQVADNYKTVKNYYFDAQIENDELFFDYLFKKGVCQNMNASFLLKKMGIVD